MGGLGSDTRMKPGRHARPGVRRSICAAGIPVVLAAILVAGLSPVRAIGDPSPGSAVRVRAIDVAPPMPVAVQREEPTDPPVEEDPPRLDVVVLLLDDVGQVGEGLFQRLPVIRRTFLQRGTVFTQAIGDTPMCCPGRASFLTGLWTWHHGVIRNDARLFHDDETIATAMQRAGYTTIYAGKYLNAMPALPDKTPDGWSRSAIFEGRYYRYPYWRDGHPEWHGTATSDYSTDVVTRDAVAFLQAAPRDRPLFAVLAPYASHSGFDQVGSFERYGVPAPRHRDDRRCAGLPRFRTAATDEADVSDKPAFLRHGARLRGDLADGWPLVPICETLLSADQLLGAVRSELARQGRLDRTVFVLVSDNGMNMGLHRLKAKGSPYAAPIPLMVNWPGGARPDPGADGIRRHTGLVSMVDLAPTVCAIAGCRLRRFPTGQRHPDGVSVLAAFRDAAPTGRLTTISSHPANNWHASHRPGWFALRTAPEHPMGAWLFVRYRNGESELYDLAADPDLLDSLASSPSDGATRDALESELVRQLGGRYRWP